ncbi:Tyrosine-protein phosphatase non-receptor type 23 [Hypsibius exemplaris]|uniref:Tyrosine-protein phosphatase non-receptor type 23 n=1 Tax=Hypsibius exemplaris TaxID=2072580 RepID=A0A1W0WIV2_HYPEX|nr:Tyrosine-protein phosphatase non-receptor type 23 [Hypsibius exemplaris]
MEAAPRLPMVSLEPKESRNTPDFGTVFRNYLKLHYGEPNTSYDKEIAELDNRRNSAVHAQKDATGLESLKRYFFELKMLYPRFPMNEGEQASVEFAWRDNFTTKDLKSKDPKFEEANILYNIGAMHSILGTMDPRKDSDSMKACCQHFQCAAGAFERIRTDYPQMPSFDQSYDVLSFYITLMLAQAHECILEKSLLDNRKSIIIAKVSAQVVDYYNVLLRALDNEATLRMPGMEGFKDFIPRQLLELKVSYYQAMVHYHMGCQSQEANKSGETIGYLKAALLELDVCRKIVKHTGDDECAIAEAFVRDIVQQRLTAVEKDNNFIYHEKVIDAKSHPAVKGTPIGKPIRFNEFEYLQPSSGGPEAKEIFQRLLPMSAYERLSLYSDKKDALMRETAATVQWKDGLLLSVISALRLEQLTPPTDFNTIPQSLLNNMAAIRSQGDITRRIDRESESLNEMTDELKKLIVEAETTLDVLKNARLEKNQASELEKLRKELTQYSAAFTVAVTSTDDLLRLIDPLKEELALLGGSVESIRNKLPSLDHLLKNENISTDLAEMKKVQSGIEKMKAQRQSILADLKAQLDGDDITKRILIPKADQLDTFLGEELKKHDERLGYLKQNMEAQDELLSRLTAVVDRLADFRAGLLTIRHQREEILRMHDDSFSSYENFNTKITEGLEFYRSLKDNVNKTKAKIEELLKQTPLGQPKPKLVQPPAPPSGEDLPHRSSLPPQGGPRLGDYIGQPKYPPGAQSSFPANVSATPVPLKSGRPTLKDYLDAKKSSQTTASDALSSGFAHQLSLQPDQQFSYQQQPQPQLAVQPQHPVQPQQLTRQPEWSPTYPPDMQYSNNAHSQYYGEHPPYQYPTPPSHTRQYQPTPLPVVNVPALRPPTVRQPPPPPATTPALFAGSLAGTSGSYQQQQQQQQPHLQPPNQAAYSTAASFHHPTASYDPAQPPQLSGGGAGYSQTGPLSGGQTPGHSTGGQTSFAGGQTVSGVIQTSFGGVQTPFTGIQAYSGGGQTHFGGGQTPSTGGQTYSAGGQTYSGGGQTHSGGSQTHSTGGQTYSAGGQTHSGGGQTHFADGQTHSGGGQSYSTGGQTHSTGNQTHSASGQAVFGGAQTSIPGTQAPFAGSQTQLPSGPAYQGNYQSQPGSTPTAQWPNSHPAAAASQYTGSTSGQYAQYAQQTPAYAPGNVAQSYPSGQQWSQNQPPLNPTTGQAQSGPTGGSSYPGSAAPWTSAASASTIAGAHTFSPTSPLQSNQLSAFQPTVLPVSQSAQFQRQYSATSDSSSSTVASGPFQTVMPSILTPTRPVIERVSSTIDQAFDTNPSTPVMTPRRLSLSSLRSTDEMLSTSPGASAEDDGILQPQVLTIEEIKRLKMQQDSGPQKDFFEDGEYLSEFQRQFGAFETSTAALLSNQEELKTLWKELQDQQARDAAKYRMGVARCSPQKNRDARIMPYDSSRVILQQAKDDYINASYVEGISGLTASRMIVTQTPLASTSSDFWTMIMEQGVEVIAAIMTDFEVNESRYWPVSREAPLTFGPITVSLRVAQSNMYPSTVEEHWSTGLLHVSHSLTKVTKSIVHLRFRGWPSNDVPGKPFELASFVKEVANYQRKQRFPAKPAAIHCQFGTGPSGVVCAALCFISNIEAGAGVPDLREVIAKLRNGRKYMIDSMSELRFLIEVCLTHGRRILHQRGLLPSYVEATAANRPQASLPPSGSKTQSGLAVPDVLSDIRLELQRRNVSPSPPGTPEQVHRTPNRSNEKPPTASQTAVNKTEPTTFMANLPQTFASLTTGTFNLDLETDAQDKKKSRITKESFSNLSAPDGSEKSWTAPKHSIPLVGWYRTVQNG